MPMVLFILAISQAYMFLPIFMPVTFASKEKRLHSSVARTNTAFQLLQKLKEKELHLRTWSTNTMELSRIRLKNSGYLLMFIHGRPQRFTMKRLPKSSKRCMTKEHLSNKPPNSSTTLKLTNIWPTVISPEPVRNVISKKHTVTNVKAVEAPSMQPT